MNFICAIDSFKGCMTSHDANEAAREGLKEAFPDAVVECYDVSDGGEGFLEAMCPDEIVECQAHDALMRPVVSRFGVKDGKAIVEVANVVGLTMIERELRNPLIATSYGIGEVMMQAYSHGCREFIIGLGGSATSDCGLGMLQCLMQECRKRGNETWRELCETSFLKDIRVTLATDVQNPLCGVDGAAHVFAPQKGADTGMVEMLERRAKNFASMAFRHLGFDKSHVPGAGAAGGIGYAFLEFMDATVASGAEIVMQTAGLADALTIGGHVDFSVCENGRGEETVVITGEGSADRQTLMGKWPAVVLAHARQAGIPVVLLAGRVSGEDDLLSAGFAKVICINDGKSTAEDALRKWVAIKRVKNACSGFDFFEKSAKKQ